MLQGHGQSENSRRAGKHPWQLLEVVLIDWLFNGTSTQKGQFVPTAGEGNRLSRLSMAKRYTAYYITLHDNNVTQFTAKHSSYINATTGYLIDLLNVLLR